MSRYLYGYWICDVLKAPFPKVNNTFKIIRIAGLSEALGYSPPVSVSLGCHVDGFALPRPNVDPVSMVWGIGARVARKTPNSNRAKLRRFKRFVALELRHNKFYTPFSRGSEPSFETWINSTPYPLWRQDELKRVYENVTLDYGEMGSGVAARLPRKFFYCKSFPKDEAYLLEKGLRTINSRSDCFKVLVGPIFSMLGDHLFHHPGEGDDVGPFMKLVPVKDRPVAIRDKMYQPGIEYLTGDFTTYEAHFHTHFKTICEWAYYSHMTQNLNIHDDLMNLLKIGSIKNRLIFKWVTALLEGCRMSGEMDTSLGNSFTTMMITRFLVYDNDKLATIKDNYEGDDSLFTVSPSTAAPTRQDYLDLGLDVKILVHKELSEASFCGLVFDPEDLVVVTDPRKVLCNTGWSDKKYVNSGSHVLGALLRSKAYSIAYQYAGCPILSSFAQYLLRVTSKVKEDKVLKTVNNMSMWMRESRLEAIRFKEQAIHIDPPGKTRGLVEKLYGISIAEQLELEYYFDTCQVLQPIKLNICMPMAWSKYYETYSDEHSDAGHCIREHGRVDRLKQTGIEIVLQVPSAKKFLCK